jgi:hypothetical protein
MHQAPRSRLITPKQLRSLNTNNALAPTSTAISRSPVTLQSINSKHLFGTGSSFSPLDLVRELKNMFGIITKHEIDAAQAAIMPPPCPLRQFPRFLQLDDSNYEFLIHQLRA